MISVSAHIDIERSPEDVWSFLMDPANDPRWERSVVHSERLDDGPIGEGSRVRRTVALGGRRLRIDREIVEFEPARHASFVIVGGPIGGGGSYTVEPVPGGTRLTYGTRHAMSGLLRLAEPALRWAYPRQLARDLATLKLAVESQPAVVEDRRN